MCAGCPGGRAVSPVTAYLNLNKLKWAVLAELQRTVGRRATITVFGDHWILHSRTGGQQVFPDVETLAGALVGKHDSVALEQIVENRTIHGAQPLDPRQFVQALLLGGGDERAGRAPVRAVGGPQPGADEQPSPSRVRHR